MKYPLSMRYGASILSVSMPGDKYVNFMVIALTGMPSILFTYTMLKYMNRGWALSISFLMTGISILASKYYSWNATISLLIFFLAKLVIHHSFTSLYVYTNEMWPTVLHHRVVSLCLMIGRIGSITAPLSPLLGTVLEMLPFYLFSGFAGLSAIMMLFLPETFRQEKLPDSIDDIRKMKK
ncbi:organic cation/carnitine transporter 2-like [Sitodiplosis mosellana]|uniref:organic cation/carnitine transporter 2-like n=1 Tax=Sitodiplosis mosellana TaxID=263140 RepID=UPI002444CD97|nr:organic cation/carnitine transporter 2-like [Sitodiplosis mosellana]